MDAGICKYDKKRDIQDVSQFGYVDLVESVKNGVVPANLQVQDAKFNGIEDPRSIIGKPSDTFEAYKMASFIAERGRKQAETNPPS